MRFRGLTLADDGGIRPIVAHETYWWHHASTARFPEDRIVEEIALRQVLSALTVPQREALVTLAAYEYSVPAAARALDISANVMHNRVYAARARFLALWHEHETPTRRYRPQRSRLPDDQLVPCGTMAAYARHHKRGEPTCEACRRTYMETVHRRWAEARSIGPVVEFGARLRHLRTGRGVSMRTLGVAAGVSDSFIFNLESGRRMTTPKLDMVKRLDEALDAGGELLALAATVTT